MAFVRSCWSAPQAKCATGCTVPVSAHRTCMHHLSCGLASIASTAVLCLQGGAGRFVQHARVAGWGRATCATCTCRWCLSLASWVSRRQSPHNTVSRYGPRAHQPFCHCLPRHGHWS
eukprot:scaffold106771_cov26-Tisochrysis_lutea.AAC.1